MDGVMEVITGRERRRRWNIADKLRIVAETREPGARIGAVAARHCVCESLVFTWRRQAREGVLVTPEMPVFMPVKMFGTPAPAPPARSDPPPSPARPPSGLIEIELGDGHQVRVGSDVNLAALRRVLSIHSVKTADARAAPFPLNSRDSASGLSDRLCASRSGL